jgi:hypothetical protein
MQIHPEKLRMVYKLQRWTGEGLPRGCDITVNVVSTLFSELTSLWYTSTNIWRNTLSQYFVNWKTVDAVFHWNWNGSQLSVYTVSLPRELGIGISLHTHEVLGDNDTLPQQTSGTPTFQDVNAESENIFFKAKLCYHISNWNTTKHCCLHIQSSNAW